MPSNRPAAVKVVAALLSLYVIWGSTYLAMRYALESYPPFAMAGIRFFIAGLLLIAWARFHGDPWPTRQQWGYSAMLGFLLLVIGNGGVAFAEQWVPSSLAAVMIASMPLWAALFSGLFGRWPTAQEWVGLGIGAVGVVLLNLEGELRSSPLGAAVLLLAACAWAFGSVWSRKLVLPRGAMSSAAQMLCAGAMMLAFTYLSGGSLPAEPTLRATLAVAYLCVFGSLVAFSAYGFLLRTVRPSLATSYAYVNPAVAVLLGVWLADETVTAYGLIGMFVILAGVALVAIKREKPAELATPPVEPAQAPRAP